MTVATKIKESMARASWIRKMFEEGARLKAQWGTDRVFDFSLGNPCLEPPEAYLLALRAHMGDNTPGMYMYMPNAGYQATREAVATHLRNERRIPLEARDIVMTCGAGGGLNVVLKTLINPGDEVLVLAPYFPEYLFYIDNQGGRPVVVTTKEDFLLDLAAIENALTASTCAIIINSPNNPTGRMYSRESLSQLGKLLTEKSRGFGRTIYLISDEPYGDIVYDGRRLPDALSVYQNAILVSSYSKSLSIPGERLGYIAAHPEAEDISNLLEGMIFCNRILGFVNAPATPQHIIQKLQGVHVNVEEYQKRRDTLCNCLAQAGYQFIRPEGAFYIFPKAPRSDDLFFVQALLSEGILVVPGSGFGAPGYFRIAFCVEESTIDGALPIFERVWKRFT